MKNKIIYIAGAILIIILFFVIKNISPLSGTETNQENSSQNNVDKIDINPSVPDITLPLSNAPKDVAWALFQKYLQYNKEQNIEGVKSVVYKISPVCADPKTIIDCKARMGQAYGYGSVLKKEDFVNVWEDEKQIILATDFKFEETDVTMGRFRAIIYFIKQGGSLKMLSFSPFKGNATDKGAASREEVIARLTIYTEDKDKDGIADYIEECIPADIKATCVSTNPKLRDTNGNGFWDGTEALIK